MSFFCKKRIIFILLSTSNGAKIIENFYPHLTHKVKKLNRRVFLYKESFENNFQSHLPHHKHARTLKYTLIIAWLR